MPVAESAKVRPEINVTPLVDVVLVLLIIFMVITPQLRTGPEVSVPVTDRPEGMPAAGAQVMLSIDEHGALWLGDEVITGDGFPERLREAIERQGGGRVLIRGDARLTFGEVKSVMLAVESAGQGEVGLIAERRNEPGAGR